MKAHQILWQNLFSKNEKQNLILGTLRESQLFSALTTSELDYLQKVVHPREYEPGEVIFTQYEKGLGMYVIARGQVEIKTHTQENPQSEQLLTTLNAGSFFGELALVDPNNKRSASAYAQGPTLLIGFFKPDLLEITDRKPEMGVKILFSLATVVGRRLRETNEQLTIEKKSA